MFAMSPQGPMMDPTQWMQMLAQQQGQLGGAPSPLPQLQQPMPAPQPAQQAPQQPDPIQQQIATLNKFLPGGNVKAPNPVLANIGQALMQLGSNGKMNAPAYEQMQALQAQRGQALAELAMMQPRMNNAIMQHMSERLFDNATLPPTEDQRNFEAVNSMTPEQRQQYNAFLDTQKPITSMVNGSQVYIPRQGIGQQPVAPTAPVGNLTPTDPATLKSLGLGGGSGNAAGNFPRYPHIMGYYGQR